MTLFMESNPATLAGAVRSAMRCIGKRRNTPDGWIRPTEGQHFAIAGLRYAPLVVGRTMA